MNKNGYVKAFADDILENDKNNKLMKHWLKEERKETIEYILEDYNDGFITAIEAVYKLATISQHRKQND